MTRPREPAFSPPRLAHRGSVEAAGFVLDERLCGPARLRERALRLWRPGATLRRLDRHRFCLRLSEPARVFVDEAPGVPLVGEGGLLCGAPGLGVEARRLGAAEGTAVALAGGEVELWPSQAGEAVDPAGWLDLSGHEVTVASGPATAAAAASAALPAVAASVREVLGDKIPRASPASKKLVSELTRLAERKPLALGQGPAEQPPPLMVRWLAGLYRLLSATLTRLMLSRGSSSLGKAAAASAASAAGSPGPRGLVVRPADPQGPGLVQQAIQRLNDLAARMMLASRMASYVGRKQAAYLERMMDLFQQGDLDEALRHAIPLGGDGGAQAPLSLGAPTPRGDLSISTGAGGQASSLLPFAGLHDELKRLYRLAFERLDAQGRVEEAAFVLAELLRESAEAVAYLERHEKWRLAAELAEGRGLPPGLVVRQWFLAGDTHRALLLARRHGVFADAVLRLEKTSPERALALRLLWADSLASAGDFLGAEQILNELPETARLRLGWLDQAIAQGGSVAFVAWVRKLQLSPGDFPEVSRALLPLIDDRAPEAPADRLALAEALLARPGGARPADPLDALRALARPLLRALLRDAGPEAPDSPLAARLQELIGDATLRIDWPSYRASASSPAPGPLKILKKESSAGSMPLLDAVVLPGGRFLVALGEAGVLLLSREGKTLHHFEQAASSLVLSAQGDRALALAPRGRVTRVARLDVAGRRSQTWCEAELSAWAPDFDGSSWFVGSQGSLVEIDALQQGWSALWQARGLGSRGAADRVLACRLVGGPEPALVAVSSGLDSELLFWRFDASTRALRQRDEILPPLRTGSPAPLVEILSSSSVLRWDTNGPLTLLRPGQPPSEHRLKIPHQQGALLSSSGPRFFLSVGGRCLSGHFGDPQPELDAEFVGASRLVAHGSPFGLALCDDRGRLVHASATVLRSLQL